MSQVQHIPETDLKRVVIVGGGFAGMELVMRLDNRMFQTVLIDRNNYHQFQPLFYQVATAGLEPSSISFPFRKYFQNKANVHFRMADALYFDHSKKQLTTSIGTIDYDYIVLAMGATTNYFGNKRLEDHSLPMKSISEALALRNTILQNYEKALNETDSKMQEGYLNLVVVGGGPTGVELAGAIAEMKSTILPKDYPELDFNRMSITLLEGSDALLKSMSETAQQKSLAYLQKLGVNVKLNTFVTDYDGLTITTQHGESLHSNNLIWAAGVKPNLLDGIPEDKIESNGRVMVDDHNEVMEGLYVLGDQAIMHSPGWEKGHPQVCQPAIQQARTLAANLKRKEKDQPQKAFVYKDKGSMATIGRNLAVCDLPYARFGGFFAWFIWMFVHLYSIVGVKNRVIIFINWAWKYLTYDQSLRLVIKPKSKSDDH